MKTKLIRDWISEDFETAKDYLENHEEETKISAVMDTGKGVTVVLPAGFPALKPHFIGVFMMAPLFLFMLILALLPVMGFLGRWGFEITPLMVTFGCGVLFWGLTQVVKLMLKNRELFPIEYFVTLGTHGISMHFSHFHFPWKNPRAAIPWREAESVQPAQIISFPALFMGIRRTLSLEITSNRGERVRIPLGHSGENSLAAARKVESMVREKINR